MEPDRAEQPSSVQLLVKYRFMIVFLGCFLLLWGNTLPWPCIPGSPYEHECLPPLITHDYEGTLTPLVIAVGTLAVLLVTQRLKKPWNIIAWLLPWMAAYLLLVARLEPDPLFGTMYFPLVDFNDQMGGAGYLVLPASLAVFWLSLRPVEMRNQWRRWAIILGILLLVLTVIFFVLEAIRMELHSQLSDAEAWLLGREGQFGPAPLVILLGGALLLAVEQAGRKVPVQPVGAVETPPLNPEPPAAVGQTMAAALASRQVYLAGYWSAITVAVTAILLFSVPWVLITLGPSSRVLSTETVDLLNIITGVLSLLGAAGFVGLMASIVRSGPQSNLGWFRLGLILAVLAGILTILQAFSSTDVFRGLIRSMVRGLGSALWPSILIALAGLCAIPAFRTDRLGRLIQWGLGIYAAATLVSGLELFVSGYSQLAYVKLIAQLGIFPITIFLMAIVFKRALKKTSLG